MGQQQQQQKGGITFGVTLALSNLRQQIRGNISLTLYSYN